MKNRFKIILLIILTLGLIFLTCYGICKQFEENEIINNIKDDVLNAKENTLLYLGSSSCDACDVEAQYFSLLLSKYDFEYYYIDLDEMASSSKKKQLLNDLDLVNDGNAILPTLAIYYDGKVIDSLTEVNNIDVIFDFLIDNEIIDDGEDLPINYVDMSYYDSYLKKDGFKLLGVTAMGSNLNLSFQKVLWSLADDYDVDIDLLTLDDLSDIELDAFISSNDFFSTDDFDTPILLISNGDTLVSYVNDVVTEDEYLEIFRNLGIIK